MAASEMTVAAKKAADDFCALGVGDIISKAGDEHRLIVLAAREGGWKMLGSFEDGASPIIPLEFLLKWDDLLSCPVDRKQSRFDWWSPFSISIEKGIGSILAKEYAFLPVADDFPGHLYGEAAHEERKIRIVARVLRNTLLPDSMAMIAALRLIGANITAKQAALFIVVCKGLVESEKDGGESWIESLGKKEAKEKPSGSS
jgi:hypothetical protein